MFIITQYKYKYKNITTWSCTAQSCAGHFGIFPPCKCTAQSSTRQKDHKTNWQASDCALFFALYSTPWWYHRTSKTNDGDPWRRSWVSNRPIKAAFSRRLQRTSLITPVGSSEVQDATFSISKHPSYIHSISILYPFYVQIQASKDITAVVSQRIQDIIHSLLYQNIHGWRYLSTERCINDNVIPK